MKMDDLDRKILSELSTNARLSMRELAKKVNLSAPSVTERVKKLESEGIIEGYTIEVNRKKIGFPIECIIEVTMKNGEHERFKRFIKDYPRAIFCYRIAGGACFIVKLSVAHLEEIEAFINSISSYAMTVTHIVFSEVNMRDRLHSLTTWRL